MERELGPAELKQALSGLLDLSTMTLATCGQEGDPHAADVYFGCGEELVLYFFSDPESQHSRDLRGNPRAAVTIHPQEERWEQILGLQMRGVVQSIKSQTAWQSAWEVYREKFPFVSELQDLIAINQLYSFRPHWIRLVDNNQGFGFNQEWGLNSPENGGEEDRTWRLLGNRNKGSKAADG
jgi:hypothetical protein